MSTETTNKKIKIDNGTTFGRTYTDKAVDELLKGAGGSSVGVIKLNESQLSTFNDNNTVTFTAEQIEILKNENISNVLLDLTAQTMLFNKYVLIEGNQFIYCILITYTPENQNNVQLYTISFDLTEPCTFVSHSIPIENYIETFDINDVFLKVTKATNYGSSTGLVTYKMGRINNKPLLVTEDKPLPDFTFTEDKTISLFGKHSILVPKNSADANILPLPADASTSTYVLKAVNGTVQWVKEA